MVLHDVRHHVPVQDICEESRGAAAVLNPDRLERWSDRLLTVYHRFEELRRDLERLIVVDPPEGCNEGATAARHEQFRPTADLAENRVDIRGFAGVEQD